MLSFILLVIVLAACSRMNCYDHEQDFDLGVE